MSEFSLSFQRGGNFHKQQYCTAKKKINHIYKNDDRNVPILINTHVVIKIHMALVTYFDSRKPSAFNNPK